MRSDLFIPVARRTQVSAGLPIIFTLPVVGTPNLAMHKSHTGWCWINREHQLLRLVCGFSLPLIILFVNVGYLIAIVWALLRRRSTASGTALADAPAKEPNEPLLPPALNPTRLILRLSLYVLVYFVIIFISGAHRYACGTPPPRVFFFPSTVLDKVLLWARSPLRTTLLFDQNSLTRTL